MTPPITVANDRFVMFNGCTYYFLRIMLLSSRDAGSETCGFKAQFDVFLSLWLWLLHLIHYILGEYIKTFLIICESK